MKIRIFLATATATSVLLASAAMAGDNNTAFVQQEGSNNKATIQQGASSNNDVGLPSAPILQNGNLNEFSELQNYAARGNNDIVAGSQIGNSNKFSSSYSNQAENNKINNILQFGNSNIATVGRNAGKNGTIGSIIQGGADLDGASGNSNLLSITQNGTGNTIGTAQQIGSNNGWSIQPPGGADWYGTFARSRWGTVISQSGSSNTLELSSIEGSNNNASGTRAAHQIIQSGNNNGNLFAKASTKGSGGNWISVSQSGNENNFDLSQGIDISSTQNETVLIQSGNENKATSTQEGSWNRVNIQQSGNKNTVESLVKGSHNGDAAFFSNAGNLASSNGLTPGDIYQTSNLNTVKLNITNSSNNQFAFLQKTGDTNTIDAKITGTGGNNVIVGVQNGNNNTGNVTQAGGSSVAVFQQIGGTNTTTITQ